MREKLTVYSFTVKWVEGKTHYIADALSRYPVFNPDQSIDAPEPEQPEIVTCLRTTSNRGIEDIIQHIKEDYKLIADAVESDQNWKKIRRQHPGKSIQGDCRDVVLRNVLMLQIFYITNSFKVKRSRSDRLNVTSLIH